MGMPDDRPPLRPEAPAGVAPEPAAPAPAYPAAAAWSTAAAVLLILFLRRPESFIHPQLFAEDGGVFYLDASRDPWGSVAVPYAGYLHLAGRLVAAICSPLDPVLVPVAYFTASVASVAALALALFSRRVGLCRPSLFALSIVLVPHSGEVFDNLTNMHWITSLGLIVLLLARDPETAAQWAFDLAYAGVTSLSGVFSILLAPLFAARAASRWTAASIATACLVAAGAAVQAGEILHHPLPSAPSDTTPLLAMATYGHRVWMGLLAPAALADGATVRARAAAGALGLAFLAALGLGGGAVRTRRILAAASLLVVAAAIFKFRGDIADLSVERNGDRYFFVPKVCMMWILLLGPRRPPALRWLCGALLAAVLLNTGLNFRFERWKDFRWPYWVERMAEGNRVEVPLNPEGYTFTYERPRPGP